MAANVLTVTEAARWLGVSRIAVQKLIEDQILPAQRVGRQWLIDPEDVRHRERTRQPKGRPCSPLVAWDRIDRGILPLDSDESDLFRRQMRARALHLNAYVHPSVVPKIGDRAGVKYGGRAAASRLELPIDTTPEDHLHLYMLEAEFQELEALAWVQVRKGSSESNATAHVVDPIGWDYIEDGLPEVAIWLDLADTDDRAARLVWDCLLRKQSAERFARLEERERTPGT